MTRQAVYPSQYKDQAAVTVESDVITAQFLPSIGAKMASLLYKPLGRELLVQRPNQTYLLQPFDGDYVAGECSGFDDMFPTIDACYYDRYPWAGTRMADHGEVWSLPWEHAVQGDRLYFSVYGVRFPYWLEKWVSFAAEAVLRIDYRLTNLSPFDFDFLWAAHTMVNLEDEVELALPDGVQSVVNTLSFSGAATYGDELTWPVCTLRDGTRRDLRILRPKSARDAEKYFIKGRLPEGWCGLKYHRSNFSLVLSFPVDRVPYLGVLPNEGGWQDLYNIFLEPGTAAFDRPDVARCRNQVATLKGRATYEWHLNIILAEGTSFRRASEDGRLEG